MARLSLSVLISTLVACSQRPVPVRSSAEREVALLTQPEVQRLAEQHCASCHQGSVSGEKPEALRVFDLDHTSWCRGLRAAQFSVFYQRMQGEVDAPTRARLLAFTQRAATAARATEAASVRSLPRGSSGAALAR